MGQSFRFTEDEVSYLRDAMGPGVDGAFFEWLLTLDASEVRMFALPEGAVAFPRVPVLRVEGPLAVCQLLETTLLNLTNYASLMTTNATRFRLAAGPSVSLLEFGLRRAQGPDGAMSAARYAYYGGFDRTSNVLAGYLFGLPVSGTHAHAFVSSFSSLDELTVRTIGTVPDIVARARELHVRLGFGATNEGELAAFLSYATAFPSKFLALVDTYDTLNSGVPNFLIVSAVLLEAGFTPVGVRLDSGDLAHLSKEARRLFRLADIRLGLDDVLGKCTIVASNDINEEVIRALNQQRHEVDAMGIGTHLVTCQAQPALGMVYKLVQVHGAPRIKVSQELSKVTLPGAKRAYRLFDRAGVPILDYLTTEDEPAPRPGERVFCRHPFEDKKRVIVTPTHVAPLLRVAWAGKRFRAFAERPGSGLRVAADHEVFDAPAAPGAGGRYDFPSHEAIRSRVKRGIQNLREDHVRDLNPTPYKVSVSTALFDLMHSLWLAEVPVQEIS
jgi:nicotinate phosphoribosyltransferase